MNTNPVRKDTSSSITINYHETATNSITDLTGTKWVFNQEIDLTLYFTYDINFISNSETFTNIKRANVRFEDDTQVGLYYGSTPVFVSSWSNFNESYRTIEITGGTDATNANLIAWLQANATQIQEQSNTFSFGNLPIANMYFGTRQVKKVYLGNALVWEKEATIIEFGISSASYQAVDGMTWGEWVASEYNTDGLVVVDGVVRTYNSPTAYPVYNGNPQEVVYSSDVIIANRIYLVDTGGGSN